LRVEETTLTIFQGRAGRAGFCVEHAQMKTFVFSGMFRGLLFKETKKHFYPQKTMFSFRNNVPSFVGAFCKSRSRLTGSQFLGDFMQSCFVLALIK